MLILREDVASIEDSSWAADWKGDKRYDPLTRKLQAPKAQLYSTQLHGPGLPLPIGTVYHSVTRPVSNRSTSYPPHRLTLLFLRL
jgi:hypothetical protein